MLYSKIIGTGSYLPERIVTNKDLEQLVDTNESWIEARTGIRQRHIAAKDQFTCDLAEKAARLAIEDAGVSAASVDLIVVATTTADQIFPSTACLLQNRLGVFGFPAFDVQAVCAGFMFALDVADKFIRTGSAKTALVVGAETFSRIINWQDRSTCILFGDGAGAVILKTSNEPGVLSTHLHSDGRHHGLLCVPVGVSKNLSVIEAGRAFTTMKGSEVFRWAVAAMGEMVNEALQANNMTTEQLDWLIPHQANTRIISAVGKKAKIPGDKVIITVHNHGNTSAASVPLALDVARKDGRIKSGQYVLLEGFGGGFTWGAALVKM